ncbi:MAG: C45 family autoproteolytic acyltransferase/hydrolase [Bryobacteraceae bacterium]
MTRSAALSTVLLLGLAAALVSRPQADPRLKNAFRKPAQNGWIFVHLAGAPAEIGFQHGYLLAPEIQDTFKVISTEITHDEKRDWEFFRKAAREMLWPRTPAEYQQEIQGIADGLKARRAKLDLYDVVAMNAWLELGYYTRWLKTQQGQKPASSAPEHCSAFVATGSYTKDGRPVIAHNAWTSYASGERWNIVFDIVPAAGHRFIMDGMAGLIHSGDDFGVNAAGIAITETTISGFSGYDPNGIPEYARARKAMQYAASIDDFARIMREGNNGGYANDWLVADMNTNEIASLELGLKNVTLDRSKDGFFVGANFPINPKLAAEETDFDLKDMGRSPNARRVRWLELMDQHKGRIDVAAAQKFLADHYDTFQKKEEPSERTIDGHIDLSPRGSQPWQPPYGTAGAVQNKAMDAALAARLGFTAFLGHACGMNFKAARHLKEHPEFAWQKGILRDMPARAWTTFAVK